MIDLLHTLYEEENIMLFNVIIRNSWNPRFYEEIA